MANEPSSAAIGAPAARSVPSYAIELHWELEALGPYYLGDLLGKGAVRQPPPTPMSPPFCGFPRSRPRRARSTGKW